MDLEQLYNEMFFSSWVTLIGRVWVRWGWYEMVVSHDIPAVQGKQALYCIYSIVTRLFFLILATWSWPPHYNRIPKCLNFFLNVVKSHSSRYNRVNTVRCMQSSCLPDVCSVWQTLNLSESMVKEHVWFSFGPRLLFLFHSLLPVTNFLSLCVVYWEKQTKTLGREKWSGIGDMVSFTADWMCVRDSPSHFSDFVVFVGNGSLRVRARLFQHALLISLVASVWSLCS